MAYGGRVRIPIRRKVVPRTQCAASRDIASRLAAASIGRSLRRRSWPGSPIEAPTQSATPIAAASDAYPVVTKQRTPASRLLERINVPEHATELLIHVRDYTKGHPSITANNHPVRHGPVVGIHNGIILNDDELLAPYSCARAEPRMTVDSEAIFALAAHSQNDPRALEELAGSMATAWLDEREPGTVFAARGVGRPLWLGRGRERGLLRLHAHGARDRVGVHRRPAAA